MGDRGHSKPYYFGVLLTRSEVAFAGRAYAAYGGVYIAASLLWLLVVEQSSSRSVGYYWCGNLSGGRSFNPFGPHDLSFTRILMDLKKQNNDSFFQIRMTNVGRILGALEATALFSTEI